MVFHHNATGGHMFRNISDVLNSKTSNMYSILGEITDNMKINNKFEFLLEYHGYQGYNRWRQALNPMVEFEVNMSTADGYEPINITWSSKEFGGLIRKNETTNTIIEGSAGNLGLWYYTIGAIYNNSWSLSKCPPLGDCFPGFESFVRIVTLWIRTINQYPAICQTIHKHHYYLPIHVLAMHFLLYH